MDWINCPALKIRYGLQVGVALVYLTGSLVQSLEVYETCGAHPRFPSPATMKKQLYNWRWQDGQDEAYFVEDIANFQLYPDSQEPKASNKPSIASLRGDRKCPKNVRQLTKDADAPMRQRSSCPWYYVLNFDRFRFPSKILTAECKCEGKCVGTRRHPTRCQPIEIQQKVLRVKTDSAGNHACENRNTYMMVKSVETVAIGCTCVYDAQDKQTGGPQHPKISE